MQLLYENDLKNKEHFCVILLFNHFNKKSFEILINKIISKNTLVAELCSAMFEIIDEGGSVLL